MNEDRFLNLAAAYGADMDRWPASERAVAAAFVAANPRVVEACLAAERLLDDTLRRYEAGAASARPSPAAAIQRRTAPSFRSRGALAMIRARIASLAACAS